jgi:hypothetical protein
VLQGDSFVACISSSPLLVESDVLTVLDLSENAIRDNGAAALAATMAAAGQASLQCWHVCSTPTVAAFNIISAPVESLQAAAQQSALLLAGVALYTTVRRLAGGVVDGSTAGMMLASNPIGCASFYRFNDDNGVMFVLQACTRP